MAELPAPMVPPDCDLQDFAFMPLMVARLRKSKAWVKARRNPALGFYMVNLWMAAWHEVPAGSLEDDDDVLADAAMCEASKWAKVRDDVLRGWVKCEDGRLYHPVVCERVLEAWQAKGERRERDDHERDRKRRERDERAKLFAALKAKDIHKPWNISLSDLRKAVRDLSGGQDPDCPAAVHDLSRLREGEGHGEGQGQGDSISAPNGAGGGKPPPNTPRSDKSGPHPDLEAIPSQVLADYLKLRKAKKAGEFTQTAIDLMRREADKAGITLQKAIETCVQYGWQGFNAGWYANREQTLPPRGQAANQPSIHDRRAAFMAGLVDPGTGEIHDDRTIDGEAHFVG